MMKFNVWAPKAEKVDIIIDNNQKSMKLVERGWWEVEIPEATAEMDYAFIVDDSKPLPDPRSPWQPNGVHQPSRLLDHSSFDWSDDRWQAPPFSNAIIYELHIGTFTPEGTFDSAIAKLDYLLELGITHVELMPVNQFAGNRGWGYDGVDLYAPHQAYGGPDGLKRFVDVCHEKGLAVILDVVYNHLGPSGNYLGFYAPYFTDRYSTPWGDAVNLDDAGSDDVRRFFIDNALMWLRDYHFDALRIDAVHAIFDHSALHFLEELATDVKTLETKTGRHLVLIAESDLNNPRIIRPNDIGGYDMTAQWNDDFHHGLHSFLTGERDGYYVDFGALEHIAKSLKRAYVYDGQYSVFRERKHGRPATGLSGNKFVGFLQNHDQIGNRAQGKRIAHLTDLNRAKIGAALVMTAPFVPMIFQGEEWAASSPFQFFTDYQDENLADAVRNGRREEFVEFGWNPEDIPDPQAEETFLRSKLNWNELAETPHSDMLNWYRELIQLRKAFPCLRDGDRENVRVKFDEQGKWLWLNRAPIWVVCNFAEKTQRIPIDSQDKEIVLASEEAVNLGEDGVELPGNSVAILSCCG
jgi:maltooligosyltrehalose trehalohydrolase